MKKKEKVYTRVWLCWLSLALQAKEQRHAVAEALLKRLLPSPHPEFSVSKVERKRLST